MREEEERERRREGKRKGLARERNDAGERKKRNGGEVTGKECAKINRRSVNGSLPLLKKKKKKEKKKR